MQTLMQLTVMSCRYVVSDATTEAPAMFCGLKAKDPARPYCADHRQLVYTASRPPGEPADPRSFRKLSVAK